MNLNLRKHSQEQPPFEEWARRYMMVVFFTEADRGRFDVDEIEQLAKSNGGRFYDLVGGNQIYLTFPLAANVVRFSLAISEYILGNNLGGGWVRWREVEFPPGPGDEFGVWEHEDSPLEDTWGIDIDTIGDLPPYFPEISIEDVEP